MSVYISTHVWHNSQHRGTELLLVLALADQAGDDGVCWPSVASLAHKTRLSERAVQNLLATVIASGEVAVVSEPRGHTSRVYRVVSPPPPERAGGGRRVGARANGRGAHSAPLKSAPGVQISASRGAESGTPGVQILEPGVQISTSRGEAGCTLNVINRKEPLVEPSEPSRARRARTTRSRQNGRSMHACWKCETDLDNDAVQGHPGPCEFSR